MREVGVLGVLRLDEFKKFLIRGNVVDLAIGVLIGVAFKSVVDSLVADIFTPLIAAVIGEPDFSSLAITINHSQITYGNFLNAALSFVITAAVIFYLIMTPVNHLLTRLNQEEQTPEPTTRKCPFCWQEIARQASRCPACTSEVEPMAIG
ncbi:MAG: large conductance mechanosensitive channel protein MscL [Dehalococcoidia bacterium]|nr:large conductance mechanosensitive channel protein MscL [Dehalococcoidia bacterium]